MDKKKKNLVILAKIRNNCNSCALLPLGNSLTYFYIKLNTYLPHLTAPLFVQGVFPSEMKTYVHTKICT